MRLVLSLALLGATGMTYGLFLSTRVRDETEAIQAALGTFFLILAVTPTKLGNF